jgi:macrolide transport system ATP-binding/permease protein
METLWQDLRYGARMLLKSPGVTLIAVVTLALGIGANSVIFSLINALLLRPLPVEDPERLVAVYTSDFGGARYGSTSYPDYVDWRDRNQVFSQLVAFQMRPFSMSVEGGNDRVFGEIVSGNYFSALGLTLALGRGFLPEEDRVPGERPVAVISHRLWQNRFGGDPATVGRIVKLNGHSFTIVGVGPETYSGLMRGIAVDLWVPAMMMEQAAPGGNDPLGRGSRSFLVTGRLKSGVTLDHAQANFRVIAEQLFKEWPQHWENSRKESRVISLISESEARVMPNFVIFMALLMTMVVLVLLIACANVANLLLARAMARRKEIAIRLSLGARRNRLIRQLITESVLLALFGGVAGLLLAGWGTGLLMTFKPPVQIPIVIDLRVDWRVLGFTFGLSLLTGILFGLVPALAASRPDVVAFLKDHVGTESSRVRLRGALVVVQVALSLMLLICSGLFIRSLRQASSVDLGFDPNNLLVMSMDWQLQGYAETAGRNMSEQLLDRVSALPGVESVSLSNSLPLGMGGSRRSVIIEGYTAQPGESTEVKWSSVAPGYFETFRIPILRGRTFNDQDRMGLPGVVVVNESFARHYWPGADPVGRRIQLGGTRSGANDPPAYLEVVGVVRDCKYATLGEEPTPFFYLNLLQHYQPSLTLIVRTRGNPIDYLSAARREVSALDKNLPLYDVKTMRQHLGLALLPARLAGSVLGIFGLAALILAAAGIYGVMAYSVAQRTREIGIRMALGASASSVLKLVVKHGMTLALIGMVLGLIASLALTRLIRPLLFGVSATDPLTFIVIVLLLSAVALLACYIPARRATKIDPMIALRQA